MSTRTQSHHVGPRGEVDGPAGVSGAGPSTSLAAGRRGETGRQGEDLAERYLTDLGWQVLDRNWRPGPGSGLRGELDLVALQPASPDNRGGPVLVVVEVKTRRSTRLGPPAAAVDAAKLARLRVLALAWAVEHEVRHVPLRVDVVSVLLRQGRAAALRHHRAVWS